MARGIRHGLCADRRGCDGDENRHRVTLTRPFSLTATEVTLSPGAGGAIGLRRSRMRTRTNGSRSSTSQGMAAAEVCAQLEGRATKPNGSMPPAAGFATPSIVGRPPANVSGRGHQWRAHEELRLKGVPTGRPVSPNGYGLFDMAGNAQGMGRDWFTRNLARQARSIQWDRRRGRRYGVPRRLVGERAGNVRVTSRAITPDNNRSAGSGFVVRGT